MHPDCTRPCLYRGAIKGRQKAFCTAACRAKYSRERSHLVDQWLRLAWTARSNPAPSKARQISELMRQLEWLLERYGGVTTIDENELPQPPDEPLDILMDHLEGIDHDDDPVWLEHVRQVEEFYGRPFSPEPINQRALQRLQARQRQPRTQPVQR